MSEQKQQVFIVGSKGIPSKYGGFESFVEYLTRYKKSQKIQYHVSCAVEPEDWTGKKEIIYNDARCFHIKWRKLGPARAIFYDTDAIKECIQYMKANPTERPILYILACRIGPFMKHYVKQVHKLGGIVYVNPDGHEWKRAKWSAPVRKYWKYSERKMVQHADLLICDSKAIEKYIQNDYAKYQPKTTFIAYGSETVKSTLEDDSKELQDWYREKSVTAGNYYLVVGRFVPENNYETMIREFMSSDTEKDLVLISNVEKNAFYEHLLSQTHMDMDKRIKFVGTVYQQELLKKIRENAYGYLHGHEVGGTNPSLLEALGSTDVNMLLDVGFNHEVGEDGAVYWTKETGSLSGLIHNVDCMTKDEITELSQRAKSRIDKEYSWDKIIHDYEEIFLKEE